MRSRGEKLRGGLNGIHGSTPNLSNDPGVMSLPRNLSSNAVKDLKGKANGYHESTDSDDSSKINLRKGRNLWRLVRESRLNADQKWKDLIGQADQI